ncbi:hypothetical protein N8590_02605 [bacterium]|mgnify:CR=1 FL=1|jgi:hypothetical protein|nr:hypothetical protein [Planctomicrobium sp.]MDA7527856.1 hypothetical protein [bacterium]
MKHLQQLLLTSIGNQVKKHGFKPRLKMQVFHRYYDWGRDSLHLCFINHVDDFDVTADIAIRFDRLEELINEENHLITKAEKKDTSTIGVELGNLAEGEQKRWTVRQESDVAGVAKEITDYFEKVGIPYLSKYGDMRETMEVLSGEERDSWMHSPLDDYRAKAAVGLAWLLNDQRRFNVLVESKREFLANVSNQNISVESFDKFVDSIRKQT